MDINDFDAAFGDAIKDAPASTVQPVVPDPATTVAAPAPAAPAGGETQAAAVTSQEAHAAEDIELEVPGTDPNAPAATEPAPAPTEPKVNQDDFLARFAEIMSAAQPRQQQQHVEQPAPRAPPPIFSPTEVNQLQQFYKDWPDVAPAVEVMQRGMVAQAMNRMYAEMSAALAPYIQTIEALADRTQLGDLQAKVPDYAQVADQLDTWVAKQPAYLQPAYRSVIANGTSDEVIDLIERFKRENGSPAQAQQPAGGGAPATTTTKPATELSPAARQAAARLAPISSKRANATIAAPTDFDSAFAQFAKTA